MKRNTPKYLVSLGILIFLVACSTKRNSAISRYHHSLNSKYNTLYNGDMALDKGVEDLKTGYNDNFWEILPVERMQVNKEANLPGQTKNANFSRAEEKATKAIQKHSMNIDGGEKNPQMDEAHLMLGKARYYDQRFIPALEAFNYVLYKYPTSDKIYEVKIWREKTNMRLENDALAVTNLRKLLKERKFKDQTFADANATLAQAFLNLKETDSAIAKLKIARDFTKENEEKARYNFILGQVYESVGYQDSAFASYEEVIDMNRKAARQYVIHSHIRQSAQFDFKTGDTVAYLKKYKNLLKDRENRPYLDVINHQMGLFYDKNKNYDQAQKYYNASLKTKSKDKYLSASNYRNLADIYFNKAKYITAGKYYDTTLAYLKPRTREYNAIKKKRENLEDVLKYEAIAQRDDSILKMTAMSAPEREAFYAAYIEKLKAAEEKAKKLEENGGESAKAVKSKNSLGQNDAASLENSKIAAANNAAFVSKPGDFYFYNANTVLVGKKEFAKKWGKRNHVENWRLSTESNEKEPADIVAEGKEGAITVSIYEPKYYIDQLPSGQKVLDSISKERNYAYFQLGVIYKEKFKENALSADKFEKLLERDPEERLVLPSLYNLYKIYQTSDPAKAEAIKLRIINSYPDSRYAQLLSNNAINLELGSPEAVYNNLFKDYENGLYRETLVKTDIAIVQFTGEEMLPKYELLKANLIGKLYGLEEYKKALNFVALTYPNTQEGKDTEKFIATKIPLLEALTFDDARPTGWKLLFQPKSIEEKDSKSLLDKLNKYAKERTVEKLTVSTDVYTKDKNLIVVHGMKTKESATAVATLLRDFKDYKIADPSIVISNENYKIVQIYKNLEEYLAGKGPNWNAKPKPEIVLPVEEEAKPVNEIQIPQNEVPGQGDPNQTTKGNVPTNSNSEESAPSMGPPGTQPTGGGKR